MVEVIAFFLTAAIMGTPFVIVILVLNRRSSVRPSVTAAASEVAMAESSEKNEAETSHPAEQRRIAKEAKRGQRRTTRQEQTEEQREAERLRVAAELEKQAQEKEQRKSRAKAAIKERYTKERMAANKWRESQRQKYASEKAALERVARRSWLVRKRERQLEFAQQERTKNLRRRRRTAEARQALVALRDAWAWFEGWSEYMGQSDLADWQGVYSDALHPELSLRWALPATEGRELKARIEALGRLPELTTELNLNFLERRLSEERTRFDSIERYPLADQQRRAIVTNEDANLVVAGAGTGKTSTVVSRVDYLVRRGLARPEQILVVAYNTSAAAELRERLERIGVPSGVTASTFHALGNMIIGQVDGKRPSISSMVEDVQERLSLFRSVIAAMLADEAGRANLVAFLADHLDEDFAGDGNSSADAQIRAERGRGLRCITGKLLRSREEVQIANWLTLNGIAWVHEEPYRFPTATPWRREYRPDFYLPDQDIYLEHFGIDRDGRTASYVNEKRYNEAIQWKRNLHRNNGTTMVETYSWMRADGVLTRDLERLLGEQGVRPRPLADDEISKIVEQANLTFSDFLVLIDTFRALFQGQGASWSTVQSHALSPRDQAFLTIFQPAYEAYRNHLEESGMIDFDDMINVAREHVRAGRFTSPFTQVIVDEFQDISATRLGLLTDLRAQAPHARLFAVGDDWQSIYRFAGSDVGIMTNLPSFVGPLARVDLDLAYRYPQELVDLSSRFVTKNPAQLQKHLQSTSGAGGGPPVTILYQKAITDEKEASALGIACEEIIGQCAGTPATALILGRYNSDKKKDVLTCLDRLNRAQISARFLTVHKAKGQEADFVILPDVRRGMKGFPSEIADDSVLRMVLSPGEAFPHAEERRLFYVALTRAKRHVYLIAPELDPSEFLVDDLYSKELRGLVRVLGAAHHKLLCPRCKGHTIVQKDGIGKAFWACEHFPQCHGRLEPCPKCSDGVMELTVSASDQDAFVCTECNYLRPPCPRCGEGFLQERNGSRGPFLGCSMFARGGCEYTCDGHDVTMCLSLGRRRYRKPEYAMPSWPIT